MKAVNLIPDDLKRGATAPTRSGTGVYALLGALALAVIAVTAYVLTSNQISANKAKLATAETQAVQAEAEAARLKPYADFSALRETRVQTVASLATSRFSWDRAMRELARVMPSNVWLTSLVGTIAPGVSFVGGGGGGDTSSIRGQVNAPAIEVVGCTETQADVSRVMARLRLMDGVSRVTLASSEKADADTASTESSDGGAAGTSDDCRHGSSKLPKFSIVVFFEPPPAATAPPAAGTGAPPATASSTGGTTTQPASTGAAQ